MKPGSAWLAALVALTFSAQLPAQDRAPERLSSVGAPRLGGLMDALFAAYAKASPGVRKGAVWRFDTDSTAIGGLLFNQIDMAVMDRPFTAAEIAPYEHQFHGDMIKEPSMVPVAMRAGNPVWIAMNRRPGSPIETDVEQFLSFVLSDAGQAVVAGQPGYAPLPAGQLSAARAGIAGFSAPVDPAIPAYRARKPVTGAIESVGSDGMKSLMDRWMDSFIAIHPRVRRGEHWEHLGTLNGFHALMLGLTDLAPMGRELWPQEEAAYRDATKLARPLEIRVARGGFNTPQRTTAQAIFVAAANPLQVISMDQLKAIFADPPAITRWGELGLGGEWADLPIHFYMPPAVSPNAMSMQIGLLGGRPWNKAVQAGSIAATAEAAAKDRASIAFGGFEEGGPGLKSLAIVPGSQKPAITATYQTASDGTYPLTRSMFIRLSRPPGEALKPQVAEFLRYILSREGQQAIVASGYFPLSEAELKIERAKLEPAKLQPASH